MRAERRLPGGGGKSDGEKSGGDKTPGSPTTPRFGSMGGDYRLETIRTAKPKQPPPNSPQVPKSIDEHASDGKSTGSFVMGPNGQSEIVFQNYLGIGVDAQAALRFHQTRNSKPNLFFSRNDEQNPLLASLERKISWNIPWLVCTAIA